MQIRRARAADIPHMVAIAETKRGQPREWSVRVLEAEVEGPARSLASGHRNN